MDGNKKKLIWTHLIAKISKNEEKKLRLQDISQKMLIDQNKTVEDTLDDFFKNDDSEFDIINTAEAQGSKKIIIKVDEDAKSEERKSEMLEDK